ncbi:MAG: SDR family NAD(P)-dependent oxidoreductase [Bacteroidetes bacterium]|nr:SDR family NAD(P)-dependent oxidoreductase [Bacteroidota bacterium]
MKLKGKKILVTGADGFIGSHLVETLVNMGGEVNALSFYNSFNHWGWLEDVNCKNKIKIISGDIRDPHFCNKISKDVDVIFNLAALIAIPYSYTAPDSYIDTNVKGTLNICHAAFENGCKRVIHCSTSEVYGSAQYVPIDEKHILQPQSPYSASKIGGDAIAISFYYSFGLPLTIARPFNTYGPRQSARAIIPTIITQIARGFKKIKIGDASPTRDFNYVTDTCNGLIALAECEKSIGETVNIGSNTEISIGDIFSMIKQLMKSDVELVREEKRIRPAKSEVKRLKCNNAKMKKLTGYNQKVTFKDGLNKTIEWFIKPKNLSKYKADIYNV